MAADDPRFDQVVASLKSGAMVRRFFEKASDPRWLQPVRDHRYFKEPPRAKRFGTSLQFVPWPAGDFLQRIASRADPSLVLAAIQDVPDTDNAVMYRSLMKALLDLPPDVAARASPNVTHWVAIPHAAPFIFQDVATLVNSLGDAGQLTEALQIARGMLAFPRSRPSHPVEVGGHPVLIRGAPLGNLDTWAYDRFLQAIAPTLAQLTATDFMQLLADTLDSALLSEFEAEGLEQHRDMSFVWYREIESQGEEPIHEYKLSLVPVLRDAALAAAATPAVGIRKVVTLLREHPWPVHTRVALHVARHHADHNPSLVRELLLDRDLFLAPEYRHEYSALLQAAFSMLDVGDRDRVFAWISDGPRDGADQRESEVWQRNRLAPISDALPEEWRRRYDELVGRYGEPGWQSDNVIGPTQFWTGPTSPVDPDQLHQMPVPEVIDLLRSWEPSGEWQSPSREGLGRSLAADVATRPGDYIQAAEEFAALDPVYATNLMFALRSSLATARGIDLAPLLVLAARIIDGGVAPPARATTVTLNGDELYDWHATRRDLAHLLEVVCRSDQLTAAQDEVVWHCVSELIVDPEPTPADEERFGAGMGAVDYSLNCVRGQAAHTLAAFLGHLVRSGRLDSTIASEGKRAVQDRLDTQIEPSTAVRAAIAMNLRGLPAVDEGWAVALVPLMFSDNRQGRVAWASALKFGGLPGSIMNAILPIFERALSAEAWLGDPDSLGPTLHLAIELFVTGYTIPVDLRESVRAAWPLATPEIRAHEVIILGNWVSRAPVTTGRPARVAELIDLIIEVEAAIPADQEGRRRPLEAIGWVIGSRRFPIEWTLATLDRIARLGVVPTDPEKIAELLADGMQRHDLQLSILASIRRIAELDKDNWAVYIARSHIAAIIASGKGSDVPGVPDRARDLEAFLLTAGRVNPDWLTNAAG